MLVERRRSAFTGDLLIRIGIAWIAVSVLLLITKLGAIRGFALPDPDDVMRLVQVRDLYAGQGWFDITQYRVDAPSGGIDMHWSRLVDLPLLAIIAGLTPFIGQASAEMVALIAVPLLTLGLSMLLAGRIAWRLLGEEETTMTVVVMALSVPLLFQMSPLRIDHHGWQVVLALAAVNGMMARNVRVGAWIAGLSVATWLSISIEGLPLAAALFGVAALRWWRNRCDKLWLAHMTKALATGSIILFGATRGFSELVTYCDAIGPVHIGMFAWGALVLSATAAAEPLPRAGLIFGFFVAGAGAVAWYVFSVPHCAAGGGFAGLDPLLEQYWHGQVSEGLPIWRQSVDVALQTVALPVLGFFASMRLALRSHDWLRRWWTDYTIILLAALTIALLVSRAGAIAAALAAVPVGWQLREWLRSIRNMKRTEVRVLALAGVACALLPALPLMLLTTAMPVQASSAPTGEIRKLSRSSACDIKTSSGVLRGLPSGEIYAPLDIGPQLLLHTDHRVIATGHHRGQDGMVFVVRTAVGSADAARDALVARGTEYVAICPGLNESEIYSRSAPEGFVAELSSDFAPEWLEPIALDGESGLKLWRIRRD